MDGTAHDGPRPLSGNHAVPQDVRVHCVVATDSSALHQQIAYIGGPNGDGTRWKISQADAVLGVDQQNWQLFIIRGDRKVYVSVAQDPTGERYLWVASERDSANGLLSLPRCQ